MTKQKYLALMQTMGKQPNPQKMPPGIQDFPFQTQVALTVFNKLGDRIQQGVGYLGKDYSSLNLHMQVNQIQDKQLFLQTLLVLDARVIQSSRKQRAQAHAKAKRKN